MTPNAERVSPRVDGERILHRGLSGVATGEGRRKSERDARTFAEGTAPLLRRCGGGAAVVKILGDSRSEKLRNATDYLKRKRINEYVKRPA